MSDRPEYSFSNRSLLANASEEDMQSIAEKELLFEYKKIVKQIDADQEELSKTRYLISQIYSQENSPNYHIKKDLQDSATKIAERINSNDRQLLALQSTPVLQNVLKREKEKAYERERQRGQEALAEYREREMRKQEELLQRYSIERQEALKKRAEIQSHYHLIDNALNKEKSLRETTEKNISKYRQNEMDKLYKARWISFAVWVGGIVLLTTIIFFLFSCDTILVPLIVSTIVVSPIIMYFLTSTTENRITAINTYGRENEIKAERDIVRMYAELLHNVDVYEFLGIPSDVKFDEHDLPHHGTNNDPKRPYGALTRYIASSYGARYHIKQGCSGAFNPIHGYELSLNEYRKDWRYYTPCQVCIGSRDSITVPQWYIYYLKITKISKQYEIKANYRK